MLGFLRRHSRVVRGLAADLADWDYDSRAWYYSIELSPGRVTPGKFGHPTALMRRLLRHAEVEGKTALDIGPMDGMMPAVLARRGASKIVAIDAYAEHRRRIETVKRALGFELDFI